jgi:hypothetical protein
MRTTNALTRAVRHLEAGNWQAAHEIVQKDASALGCWAHGIVHLLEGDLGNAQYWYRRARRTFPHLDCVGAEIAALKDAVSVPPSRTAPAKRAHRPTHA